MNENKKGVRAPIRTTKTKNPVAKNASAAIGGGAAGAHKDKKKAMKAGEVKHKKAEFAESYEQHLQNKLNEATKVDPNAKFDYDAWSKSGKKPREPGKYDKALARQTRDANAKKKEQGVAEGQLDEATARDVLLGLLDKFYADMKLPPRQNSHTGLLNIKSPGTRVWTRGDGTRHRDPGGIEVNYFTDDKKASEKALVKFWPWLLKQPGVKSIGQISGEFSSSPMKDAVAYKGLYFTGGQYGVQFGSLSRIKNPKSVWRHQPPATPQPQDDQGVAEDIHGKSPFELGAADAYYGRNFIHQVQGYGFEPGTPEFSEYVAGFHSEDGKDGKDYGNARPGPVQPRRITRTPEAMNGITGPGMMRDPAMEDEGDAEGLPHLTAELASHIAQQIDTEGAHAIVKSVTWGDGAADELVQFIKAALLKLASVGSMKEATTSRDKWNKASAERQQKHDKIAATQTKNGSGMKSAIDRLEKHVNAKEGWTHDSLADQLFEHERTYEEKLQNQLNKLTKK